MKHVGMQLLTTLGQKGVGQLDQKKNYDLDHIDCVGNTSDNSSRIV